MPCEYYTRPEKAAEDAAQISILESGRKNPFILYVHHWQVEKELETYRRIVKNLIVKNLVDREDIPVKSISLEDTIMEISSYYDRKHEYPSLNEAKSVVDEMAKFKHISRNEWEKNNDEVQRQGIRDNFKAYEEARK